MKQTIKLSALEAVEVEPVGDAGRVEVRFIMGSVPVAKKQLRWDQASALSDALSLALEEAVQRADDKP